jgi:hypothetical protein
MKFSDVALGFASVERHLPSAGPDESPYQDEERKPAEPHHGGMSQPSDTSDTYEIKVRGELSDQMVRAIGGSRLTNAATTIVISVEDKAARTSLRDSSRRGFRPRAGIGDSCVA